MEYMGNKLWFEKSGKEYIAKGHNNVHFRIRQTKNGIDATFNPGLIRTMKANMLIESSNGKLTFTEKFKNKVDERMKYMRETKYVISILKDFGVELTDYEKEYIDNLNSYTLLNRFRRRKIDEALS